MHPDTADKTIQGQRRQRVASAAGTNATRCTATSVVGEHAVRLLF
jgi:hypothetical protein